MKGNSIYRKKNKIMVVNRQDLIFGFIDFGTDENNRRLVAD